MTVPLILFAKAPIQGQVKTRLQSHCSAEQAAKIFEVLLEETVRTATEHWPGDVVLSVWLDDQHPFLQHLWSTYPLKKDQQVAGHLGQKMCAAMNSWGYPAAVMGCDVPHIDAGVLKQAYKTIISGRSVVGPADDGGYYFLGLSRPADTLFDDQRWGQSDVMKTTMRRAQQLGLPLIELPSLNDIDTWQDLLSVIERVPGLRSLLISEKLTTEKLMSEKLIAKI